MLESLLHIEDYHWVQEVLHWSDLHYIYYQTYIKNPKEVILLYIIHIVLANCDIISSPTQILAIPPPGLGKMSTLYCKESQL